MSKDTYEFNRIIIQLDITNIHPVRSRLYILLKPTWNIHQDNHILNKTHLNKLKDIGQYLFSDHNGTKLEISIRKRAGKFQTSWRLNDTLQNNTWIKGETLREIFKYF